MKALRALPWVAALVAAAIAASGYGARYGAWDFSTGFSILRYATYAGLAVAAIALVALCIPRTRARNAGVLAVAFVVAAASAALPLYWLQQARTLPPINDITTDLDDPPEFAAIAPLRANAPVSAAYGGKATADAQRSGYPDIGPVDLAQTPAAAFDRALSVARAMGWTIVASDARTGRIEATATTAWFGFRDDVVIRVTPRGSGSRVDVRSHSRVGRGDLGANARRVRDFSARLRS